MANSWSLRRSRKTARTIRYSLFAIRSFQQPHPDRTRQVARATPGIDSSNQAREAGRILGCSALQGVPELGLERQAGAVPGNGHRPLDRRKRRRTPAVRSGHESSGLRRWPSSLVSSCSRRALASDRSALLLPKRARFSAAVSSLRTRFLRLRWSRRFTISAVIYSGPIIFLGSTRLSNSA